MKIRLESLNLDFAEFLTVLYHATGKNFVYEHRVAQFSRDYPKFVSEVFTFCEKSEITFDLQNVFAKEDEIFAVVFGDRCEPQTPFAIRKAHNQSIQLLKKFINHKVCFEIKNAADVCAVLKFSPPLYEKTKDKFSKHLERIA